jgi:hypothetical protein
MGMKQMVRNATQLANVGKVNRAMKPSETAITRNEAVIPKAGCFTSASFFHAAAERRTPQRLLASANHIFQYPTVKRSR